MHASECFKQMIEKMLCANKSGASSKALPFIFHIVPYSRFRKTAMLFQRHSIVRRDLHTYRPFPRLGLYFRILAKE